MKFSFKIGSFFFKVIDLLNENLKSNKELKNFKKIKK